MLGIPCKLRKKSCFIYVCWLIYCSNTCLLELTLLSWIILRGKAHFRRLHNTGGKSWIIQTRYFIKVVLKACGRLLAIENILPDIGHLTFFWRIDQSVRRVSFKSKDEYYNYNHIAAKGVNHTPYSIMKTNRDNVLIVLHSFLVALYLNYRI